jgi:hypothetical protein
MLDFAVNQFNFATDLISYFAKLLNSKELNFFFIKFVIIFMQFDF